MGTQVLGHVPGQPIDRGVGDTVGNRRDEHLARKRGDAHDESSSRAHQQRCGQRRGDVVGSDPDPVHRVPYSQRLLPERSRVELGPVREALVTAPGTVDQYIEAPLLVRYLLHHGSELVVMPASHRAAIPVPPSSVTWAAVDWMVPGSLAGEAPSTTVRPVT